MPRKILISFLGTTNYTECNYYLEEAHDKEARGVKYVQKAIVQLVCHDFGPADSLYFFLTEDARKTNWEDEGFPGNEGLASRLNKLALKPQIVPVGVKEGYDVDEIWSIFQQVFNSIQEEDEIIVDVTHAFRSLPILVMTLSTYARALKKVKIRKICYGAFEALGKPFEIKDMPLEDRNAPILDLTAFSDLQEWSLATRDFNEFGHGMALAEQANRWSSNLNQPVQEKLREFGANLSRLTQSLATVRGRDIIKGDLISDLLEVIRELRRLDLPSPFLPLMEKVEQKIAVFKGQDDILNGFAGVSWCISHQLIQQGITLTQEVLITWLINYLDQNGVASLKTFEFGDREYLSKVLRIVIVKKQPLDSWRAPLRKEKQAEIEAIASDPVAKQLAEPHYKLAKIRNDINHGGFTDSNPPEQFRLELVDKFNVIQTIIRRYS